MALCTWAGCGQALDPPRPCQRLITRRAVGGHPDLPGGATGLPAGGQALTLLDRLACHGPTRSAIHRHIGAMPTSMCTRIRGHFAASLRHAYLALRADAWLAGSY
jgi:hypothetical protein